MAGRRSDSKYGVDTADLAMLATLFIWAGNNIITKGVVDTIAPLPYVFFRFLFVVVIVFSLYLIRGHIPAIPRVDLKWFLLTGLTGYALYNALFTAGLKYTTTFSTAVIISSAPLLTTVFARVFGIETMTKPQWLGFVLSLLGVVVFVSDKLVDGKPAWGDLLSFMAAISFAIYSLATRPLVQRHGSLMVTAWSSLIGLVMIAPVAAIPIVRQDWGSVGIPGWGALLYSSALSMLLAYTIWGWAIQHGGVARTALFLYFIPVLTGVLSYVFMGESFGIVKILGALFVFAGVVLARSQIGLRSRPAPGDPGPRNRGILR